MQDIKDGMQLKAVIVRTLNDGSEHAYYLSNERNNGPHRCSKIEVFMQSGQMAEVPWAYAWQNDGSKVLINLSNAEAIILA